MALSPRSPTGRRRVAGRAATCLAVDPDLVATAAAMRQGTWSRADGTRRPAPGPRSPAAGSTGLAAAARGGCVVALPFADADLVALARGELGDLGGSPSPARAAVVAGILGTPVLDATTWPADGVLDEPALDEVAAAGEPRGRPATADAVDGGPAARRRGGAARRDRPASSLFAVLTDPLLSRAAPRPPPAGAAGAAGARAAVAP